MNSRESRAGNTTQTAAKPIHIITSGSAVESMTPIGPTNPQVPIPAATPLHCSPNTMVEMGPVTAEAKMGASQITGFFTMLPIWSMEVPNPWETIPPQRFSRKLITAKPDQYRKYLTASRNFYETWKENGMGGWKLSKIPTPPDDGVMDVLMIGNSWCYYYVEELYALAAAAGVKMRVCNLF